MHLTTRESRERYEAALLKQPADVDAPPFWKGPVVAAGSVVALSVLMRRSSVVRYAAGGVALASSAVTLLTANALVQLGRFATNLESASLRAVEEGLMPPRRSELRSGEYRTGEDRMNFINAVGTYKGTGDGMLYRD